MPAPEEHRWPAVWTARWIWGEAPQGDLRSLMAATSAPEWSWNRWFHLRRSFRLEAVPRSVPCRLTADSRYVLYVNGREAGRGPARSVPERLTWAEVDLAPLLQPGDNAIAVLVRFYGNAMAWWRPARPSFQLGYGGLLLEAPALGIRTDGSWRSRPAAYRRAVPGEAGSPVTEVLDGGSVPAGWAEAGYDDGGWDHAVELQGELLTDDRFRVPSHPYPAMEHDDLAPLTAADQPLAPLGTVTVPASSADDPVSAWGDPQPGSGTHPCEVWDAGRITLATPWVEVAGPPGAVVDLYAGEDLDGDGRVVIEPRRYGLRYVLSGRGTERLEAYEAVGFRYLGVALRGEVDLRGAGAIERRYPRSGDASFSCDDPRLERIWEVGARTLDVCSTDAFLDCPGREQRAWVGDAYVHGLLTYVCNADWRLARRNLVLCARTQRPDGLLAMAAGGDLSHAAVTIPDYSLHWVRGLARYYEHSGDAGTVRRLVPTALQVLDTFEGWRDGDGLLHGVPGWVFVDWAQTERAEVVGALNALHAAALEDLASMLESLDGDQGRARRLRAAADRTREGFEALWDPGRGVYADAADGSGRRQRVSQQTNAAAILGGCAPPERWRAMLDRVLDPERLVVTATPADLPGRARLRGQWADPSDFTAFDEKEDVVAAQPFFSHFLHQAVVKAGRRDLVAGLCLRWWPQIERGNTTFEEYWDAPPGQASRTHAWGATPTYDLTAHVLGIHPLAPGYQRVELRPHFGHLGRLGGRVPTPRGWLAADLGRGGGTVDVPPGTSVVVDPGDADLPACELGPGRHTLGSGP